MCGETSAVMPGPLGRLDDDGPGALPRQPAAAGVQEHRARPFVARPLPRWSSSEQLGSAPHDVGLHGLAGVAADRHDPLLGPLAAQQHGAAGRVVGIEVEVVEVQPDGLGDARAGAVEHLQQRPVAHARAPCPGHRPPRAASRRPPSGTALGSRFAGVGGRTPAEGSAVASPSLTANLWNPRTATTVRPAEVALSGWCSLSPSRSAIRKPLTVCSVIWSSSVTPTESR